MEAQSACVCEDRLICMTTKCTERWQID